MARMIPAEVYRGTPSRGEKEIFYRLKNDPKTTDWIVLHSLDIVHHVKRLSGEVDFVVVVPGKGVLCLEVKASSNIRREKGLWYYGKSPKPDRRGPFKQSAEAMHSIRNQIKKNASLSGIPFWSAVIFPYLEFSICSSEWHSWQVIDAHDFRRYPISQLILSVLSEARRFLKSSGAIWFDNTANEPTKSQCDQLARILRPDFEVYEPPHDQVKRLEEDIKRYTEEQFVALDAMAANPRVIFAGPAGTGKTTLAIEAARRSRVTGNRVLFVCYNRLLGQYLEAETIALQPEVTVTTLHRHMLNITEIHPHEVQYSSEFWSEDLPQKAIDRLLENTSGRYLYDEVIIDEAQDLLRDNYLDFIDLSLKGGLGAGKWKLFGDFEKQAIYHSDDEASIDDILRTRFPHIPSYSIRVNCRNAPRVATLVHLLGRLDPEYSRVLRPDDGVEPEIVYYSDDADQVKQLLRIINEMIKEGYAISDVAVLSTKALDKSIVRLANTSRTLAFANFEGASEQQVKCGSIHSFKGMESRVVIVTDVEHIAGDQAAALFYIAMTRALHRLYVFAQANVRQEVLSIILSQ